jgi:hypothetical protein
MSRFAALLLALGVGCQQGQQETPPITGTVVKSAASPATDEKDDSPVRDLSSSGLDLRVRLPEAVVLKPQEAPSEKEPKPVVVEATFGKLGLRFEKVAVPPTDPDLARRDGEWSVSSPRTPTETGWWVVLQRAQPPAIRLVEYRSASQALCTVDGLESRIDLKDAQKICRGMR